MVTELDHTYEEVLKKETKPYVLEFYTPWCGVCKQVMPLFEEVAKEYADKYSFYKINAEQVNEFAKKYGINSVPALIFIQDGQVKEKHIGYISKDDIIEKIKKNFE